MFYTHDSCKRPTRNPTLHQVITERLGPISVCGAGSIRAARRGLGVCWGKGWGGGWEGAEIGRTALRAPRDSAWGALWWWPWGIRLAEEHAPLVPPSPFCTFCS